MTVMISVKDWISFKKGSGVNPGVGVADLKGVGVGVMVGARS